MDQRGGPKRQKTPLSPLSSRAALAAEVLFAAEITEGKAGSRPQKGDEGYHIMTGACNGLIDYPRRGKEEGATVEEEGLQKNKVRGGIKSQTTQ